MFMPWLDPIEVGANSSIAPPLTIPRGKRCHAGSGLRNPQPCSAEREGYRASPWPVSLFPSWNYLPFSQTKCPPSHTPTRANPLNPAD